LFVEWHGREKFGYFSRQEDGIFFNFQRIILLVVWDGVFGESGWVFFVFFSFVIWWLNEIYLFIYGERKIFNTKILFKFFN
jgi:hypothetical protein